MNDIFKKIQIKRVLTRKNDALWGIIRSLRVCQTKNMLIPGNCKFQV